MTCTPPQDNETNETLVEKNKVVAEEIGEDANTQHTTTSSTTPQESSNTNDPSNLITPRTSAAIEEYILTDLVDVEVMALRIYHMECIFPLLYKHMPTRTSTSTSTDIDIITRSLSIRKNLIHTIAPIPTPFVLRLTTLDLYDNKISEIEHLNELVHLQKLDLSYNQIKHIKGLDTLTELKELYLVENKIKKIQGLSNLRSLELLELGGNAIRRIDADSFVGLHSLRELYLGKNKIEQLEHFDCLISLDKLSLQANRIASVPSNTFHCNTRLKELYLSENGIAHMDDIADHLKELELLDFSFNPIMTLKGVEKLSPSLKEFWLTDGKISDYAELTRFASLPQLHTVYLERNPIEKDKRYRCKVLHAIPWIVQIDSWPIVNKENPEADRSRDKLAAGVEEEVVEEEVE